MATGEDRTIGEGEWHGWELGVSNGANPTGVPTTGLDGTVVQPFDIFALENVDAEELCRKMTEWGFNGVKFTPFRFKPPTGKYR